MPRQAELVLEYPNASEWSASIYVLSSTAAGKAPSMAEAEAAESPRTWATDLTDSRC